MLMMLETAGTPVKVCHFGDLSEWLKEAGCKPVGSAYVGSNPAIPTNSAGTPDKVCPFIGTWRNW